MADFDINKIKNDLKELGYAEKLAYLKDISYELTAEQDTKDMLDDDYDELQVVIDDVNDLTESIKAEHNSDMAHQIVEEAKQFISEHCLSIQFRVNNSDKNPYVEFSFNGYDFYIEPVIKKEECNIQIYHKERPIKNVIFEDNMMEIADRIGTEYRYGTDKLKIIVGEEYGGQEVRRIITNISK